MCNLVATDVASPAKPEASDLPRSLHKICELIRSNAVFAFYFINMFWNLVIFFGETHFCWPALRCLAATIAGQSHEGNKLKPLNTETQRKESSLARDDRYAGEQCTARLPCCTMEEQQENNSHSLWLDVFLLGFSVPPCLRGERFVALTLFVRLPWPLLLHMR